MVLLSNKHLSYLALGLNHLSMNKMKSCESVVKIGCHKSDQKYRIFDLSEFKNGE